MVTRAWVRRGWRQGADGHGVLLEYARVGGIIPVFAAQWGNYGWQQQTEYFKTASDPGITLLCIFPSEQKYTLIKLCVCEYFSHRFFAVEKKWK